MVRGVVHGLWKLFTLRTFPNWVKHTSWFRLLRFSALCCGADSPRHRFKHCKANTTLRVLGLFENLIGNEGACALAVALKAPVVVCKAFCGGCSASLHSRVSNLARDENEVHALRTQWWLLACLVEALHRCVVIARRTCVNVRVDLTDQQDESDAEGSTETSVPSPRSIPCPPFILERVRWCLACRS